MTREEYIELVQARLLRIDSAGRFKSQYVEGAMDMVWQSMAFQHFGAFGTDENFYTKLFTPVTVSQDSHGNYYSDLPEKIINLPRVSSGIVRINQINGRDMDFSPVSERDFIMMVSQEVYQLTDKITYYVTFERIHFGSNMTTAIATAGLDIRMVIPFRSYDLDEDLPIMVGQADMFINNSMQFLIGSAPVDLENKNAETPMQ